MDEGQAGTALAPCVVHVFGRSRVEIDGTELVIRGPIKRGLVAMLALDLGRSVHADMLVDGLWEANASWDVLQSLRVHISQLRTFLDRHVAGARQFIEGRYPLYRFSDHVTTDFARSSALRDRALDRLAEDPRAALLDLEAARRLVADDPLAEVLHLPFAQFAVESLRVFQLQLAEDYDAVAAAVWGSSNLDASTDRSRPTSMDERRWRLFTRLVDAPTPAERSISEPVAERGGATGSNRPSPTSVPSQLTSRIPARFVGRQGNAGSCSSSSAPWSVSSEPGSCGSSARAEWGRRAWPRRFPATSPPMVRPSSTRPGPVPPLQPMHPWCQRA